MSITICDLNLIGIEIENANINVVQKGNFFSSFCFRITKQSFETFFLYKNTTNEMIFQFIIF